MKIALLSLALIVSSASNAEPRFSEDDSARIVRAATRLVVAKPDAWTFMIVTELPSEKYVQFSSDTGTIAFDFPVLVALQAGIEGPFRDAHCSSSSPKKRSEEVERRYLSSEEEARLKAFLNAAGHQWRVRYCLSETKEGQRAGYNVSITGGLKEPKAVPPFIRLVFKDVYLLPAVRGIEIETDE